MDLLPKNVINFAEKDYWDTFFKNRQNKDFEWYGEYLELCSHLHKYIKPKDSILVVGCGNSQLSANMYDVGYRNISNIDVSTVVIKQMKQLNKERDLMTFEVMDALNMSYPEQHFSVILDKGTLDALMPQDTPADLERGHGLISEVARVLKSSGRYIVVSLLQNHILRTLLKECCDRGWMMRVCRCHEVEEKTLEESNQGVRMPVFLIVCTKFRKMDNTVPILELWLSSSDKPTRVTDPEEVDRCIKEVQKTTAMCHAIQKQVMKEELEMEFRREEDTTPRYMIRVVDHVGSRPSGGRRLTYGALIVPHGRETEWMFGSREGRELLRKSSKFDRLAVISLSRDHSYPSMDAIQKELGSCVRQLAPSAASSHIPFVTVGDGLGSRDTIFKGHSQLSGDFVVEDVSINGCRYRRLIFLNNQAVVQSEAKLKSERNKKRVEKWTVDTSYVSCAHHCYMSIAAAMATAARTTTCTAIVLGLGGGALCTLLQRVFPQIHLVAVDIDPAIVKVAEDHFGVRRNDHLAVEVADGLSYLEECAASDRNVDIVMVDVDAKGNTSALHCPPPAFVADQALDHSAHILGQTGILVLNIVCRVDSLKEEILSRIRGKFRLVARYSLAEDVNEVVLASHSPHLTESEWRNQIHAAATTLNLHSKKKLARKDDLIDLVHLVKNMVITS